MHRRAAWSCGAFALGITWSLAAAADPLPLALHVEADGTVPLGDPQAHEYGVGAHGAAGVEVPLTRAFGLDLEGGAVWLPRKSAPSDPTIADHGSGDALTAMAGVRAHPVTAFAGPWMAVHAGLVSTGSLARFGAEAQVGYDFRVGDGRWDVGPYAGYLEIVEPASALRPGDARLLSVGVHVALGAEKPRLAPSVEEPPAPVASAAPPPPPVEAPPPDRDGDGVVDADDVCPDLPGVPTQDPATNGCPRPVEQVRVVEDRIEYDDVILFDTDSPHVHHASWAALQKLARFIDANPDIQQVDITGHADERGTEEHNLGLSRSRADAVRVLLARFGVEEKRLTTLGVGFGRPRAPGHTPADWARNRRVEFIITKVRNVRGGTTTLTSAATPALGGTQ